MCVATERYSIREDPIPWTASEIFWRKREKEFTAQKECDGLVARSQKVIGRRERGKKESKIIVFILSTCWTEIGRERIHGATVSTSSEQCLLIGDTAFYSLRVTRYDLDRLFGRPGKNDVAEVMPTTGAKGQTTCSWKGKESWRIKSSQVDFASILHVSRATKWSFFLSYSGILQEEINWVQQKKNQCPRHYYYGVSEQRHSGRDSVLFYSIALEASVKRSLWSCASTWKDAYESRMPRWGNYWPAAWLALRPSLPLSLSFFFFKSMKLTRWKSNSACRWGHRVAGVPSSKKSFFFPFFLSRSIPSFSPFISILFT